MAGVSTNERFCAGKGRNSVRRRHVRAATRPQVAGEPATARSVPRKCCVVSHQSRYARRGGQRPMVLNQQVTRRCGNEPEGVVCHKPAALTVTVTVPSTVKPNHAVRAAVADASGMKTAKSRRLKGLSPAEPRIGSINSTRRQANAARKAAANRKGGSNREGRHNVTRSP